MQENPSQNPGLSLETPEAAAERVQGTAPAQPSVMDNLRTAQASGDPVAVEAATKAADEEYMLPGNKPSEISEEVNPVKHDQQVEDYHANLIKVASDQRAKKDEDYIEKFNSDIDFRLREKIDNLNKTIVSIAEGLSAAIDGASRGNDLKVLAAKDPLYFARDTIGSIVRDMIDKNPTLSEDVATKQQTELYLDRLKDVLKSKNYNPKIVDVLAADKYSEDKALELKSLV